MLRTLFRLAQDVHRYRTFVYGSCRGVFADFTAARKAVAASELIGFNHPELARDYIARTTLDLPSFEYPVMYHLGRILFGAATVLDFGGNIGIHYRRYQAYLDLAGVEWIVCDVPEIVRAGRAVCAAIPNIKFISEICQMQGRAVDVFLASGVIQYLDDAEAPLTRLRPTHLLINRLPLYDGERFVTLQNGGLVQYPQHVFNRQEFVAGICRMGYRLRDSWQDDADSCVIPFHPGRSLPAYSGLYFSASGG